MRLKVTLIAILLISSMSIYAQKYKDVFPQIRSMDNEKSFEILHAFLQTNLDHPNANLRIALIYLERFKSVDVLKEYEKAMAIAEQAKMKFFKAKIVVTDKELKKNSDYYFGLVNVGSSPSYAEISTLITNSEATINNFLLKAPLIYAQFTKSVEKYDQAVKSFSKIVGSYKSLKELYLLYNDSLKKEFVTLKSNYDSTKIYFDNYLTLREAYRINAIKQTYSEVPINIYRLDGLVTQINFLQPNIKLWNYTAWVDSVNQVVDNTIAQLRQSLISNEKKLRMGVEEIEKDKNPDNVNIIHADKALIFNLLKYDYNNSIVPLLTYYEFKQQFMVDQNRQQYFDTASISPDRRLAYFSDMMYTALAGDSIISEFDSRYNQQQLLRHKEFIDKTFGSPEKMKAYMDDEKAENKKIYLRQVANIKNEILTIQQPDPETKSVKYKKMEIPLYKNSLTQDQLAQGQISTQFLLHSADESLYIASIRIADHKKLNREVVLTKLSKAMKPVWVKSIDLEIDSAGTDANHWLGDVVLTSEGVALLIHSVALSDGKEINTLMHYTASGKLKSSLRLKTSLYPREINFIEANNMFILSFFGKTKDINPQVKSDMIVLSINGLDQPVWQFNYSLNGNYVGMITTKKGYLINGNYSVIKNQAGQIFTKTTGSNAYIISLAEDGALNSVECLESATNYSINSVFKVNDRNINLLGTKGEQIIINSDLKKIYSSVLLK